MLGCSLPPRSSFVPWWGTLALVAWGATASSRLVAQAPSAEAFRANHAWVDPLGIPLALSGNFGELRGNHFHTGIDLKTQGREGVPVLAATSGRVARVKMSPWGYGNALYLEGPEGITTVYAHLQSFSPEVQAWAVQRTYKGRTLGLDASPSPENAFRFAAGDTLGWSGNSGSSGGPHLHFEVRETASQHPLNPLDGWVTKPDSRPPTLGTLWVETADGVLVPCAPGDTVAVHGTWRASVEGFDLLDGANNVCGIRTLHARIWQDSSVLATHAFTLDELDFSVNKDMNAHTLYPVWASSRAQVHRLHRLTANRLGIYESPVDESWIQGATGKVASVEVEVTDAAGNATAQTWWVRQLPGTPASTPPPLLALARPETAGTWAAANERVRLSWGKGTFFEETFVGWEAGASPWEGRLMPEDAPYRKPVTVTWELPAEGNSLSGFLGAYPATPLPRDRWVLVRRDADGELDEVVQARWNDGGVVASLPDGGLWRIERDTVPPEVKPYHSGTPLVANGDAVWFVDDALSGVDALEAHLDGAWMRLVWDPKRRMVTYQGTDALHTVGEPHVVELRVTDASGNVASWSRTLTWPLAAK